VSSLKNRYCGFGFCWQVLTSRVSVILRQPIWTAKPISKSSKPFQKLLLWSTRAILARLSGRLKSEQPNSSLYTYEATLTMHAAEERKSYPSSPDQLLLRGATLRNTLWIHGVVVFTGHETKLMRTPRPLRSSEQPSNTPSTLQILMLVGI